MLVLLIVSQFDFVIGSFFPDDSEKKFGFLGWDNATELFKKVQLHTLFASVEKY